MWNRPAYMSRRTLTRDYAQASTVTPISSSVPRRAVVDDDSHRMVTSSRAASLQELLAFSEDRHVDQPLKIKQTGENCSDFQFWFVAASCSLREG
jgi:hypothetical protein